MRENKISKLEKQQDKTLPIFDEDVTYEREFDVEESVFSDNFFDLHADDTEIYVDKTTLSEQLTLEEFEKQLSVVSYHEVLY